MLAEAVVQVLPDASLLAVADVENCSLETFALRDLDARRNHVAHRSIGVRQNGRRPTDETPFTFFRYPITLIVVDRLPRTRAVENRLKPAVILGREKQVPNSLSADFFDCVSGGLFRRSIEARDSSLGIEHHDQRTHCIEDCG